MSPSATTANRQKVMPATLLLTALFATIITPPAYATPITTDKCEDLTQTSVLHAAQAVQMLYDALPIDITLGTATGNALLEALSSLVIAQTGETPVNDPSVPPTPSTLYIEAAVLIAIARPELEPAIEGQLLALYPETGNQLSRCIETAAHHPTPDQLAAIAAREGVSPAAGTDSNNGKGE